MSLGTWSVCIDLLWPVRIGYLHAVCVVLKFFTGLPRSIRWDTLISTWLLKFVFIYILVDKCLTGLPCKEKKRQEEIIFVSNCASSDTYLERNTTASSIKVSLIPYFTVAKVSCCNVAKDVTTNGLQQMLFLCPEVCIFPPWKIFILKSSFNK